MVVRCSAGLAGGFVENDLQNPKRSNYTMSHKWVYLFNEVDEAQKYMDGSWDGVRALLGGKGAGLADMNRGKLPVPPGFTVTTEACNAYLAGGRAVPRRPVGAGAGRHEGHRGRHRQGLRRPQQSAAGLLPLRRQVLHARHDGHGAQHRPQRRHRGRHGQADRQRQVRLRLLPAPGADVRLGGDGRSQG